MLTYCSSKRKQIYQLRKTSDNLMYQKKNFTLHFKVLLAGLRITLTVDNVNRWKTNLILYIWEIKIDMRLQRQISKMKYICHLELRRGQGSETSEREIHRKMKRIKFWYKNVCWLIQKHWGIERDFTQYTHIT